MKQQPIVSISIVSHQQGALVAALLPDIAAHCTMPLEVILTLNLPETLPFDVASFPFPVKIVKNATPKGFGANHNAAFSMVRSEYFCVLNPDIRLNNDPFPALISGLSGEKAGVAGPLVLGPEGNIEDSARRFPTSGSILRKLFGRAGEPDYAVAQSFVYPDWIAGMFMLWRMTAFREVGGFDERYFLYYEDADICSRLPAAGYRVVLVPGALVTHHAQRASHRSPQYLRWHLSSMLRFFWKRFVGGRDVQLKY